MSETLVIVFPGLEAALDDFVGWLRQLGDPVLEGRFLTLSREEEWLYFVQVTDLKADGVFEDWPDSLVPKGLMSVFSVDYRSVDLVVDAVHLIAEKANCLIDTNSGQIVDGAVLDVAMIR